MMSDDERSLLDKECIVGLPQDGQVSVTTVMTRYRIRGSVNRPCAGYLERDALNLSKFARDRGGGRVTFAVAELR